MQCLLGGEPPPYPYQRIVLTPSPSWMLHPELTRLQLMKTSTPASGGDAVQEGHADPGGWVVASYPEDCRTLAPVVLVLHWLPSQLRCNPLPRQFSPWTHGCLQSLPTWG
jgi:hypothetical protein